MRYFIYSVVLLCFYSTLAYADAVIPTADLPGTADITFLGRYQGSVIVAYRRGEFERFVLPLAPLKARPDKRDSHNNIRFAPEKSRIIEGAHTRLVYLLPEGRTPLEAAVNYRRTIMDKGGKVLFSCGKEICGGDPHRASEGGGGDMSLAMFLQSEEDVLAYNESFSNGHCALTSRITGQQYLTAELPEQHAFISVLAYTVANDDFCRVFKHRTVVVLDVIVPRIMEQKIVVVRAEEMARKINDQGKVALYGIYFGINKVVVKKESRPTLNEIAKMLTDRPKLKILVVGHTDSAGSFAYNLDLSQRRARAVVSILHKEYGVSEKRLKSFGVSFSCPAATNRTEKGRARNRRVELVTW